MSLGCLYDTGIDLVRAYVSHLDLTMGGELTLSRRLCNPKYLSTVFVRLSLIHDIQEGIL